MNNAPIEGGRGSDAEALAAQMERMIEQVARDPALGALAEYYGGEVLPEDLDARLLALQTIAHGHWDRRQ